MNFLTICQEVNKLVGLQGNILSVTTVSGYQATLVKYVQNAYDDIQNLRDQGDFLKSSVSISLVAGTTTYTIEDIFNLTPTQVTAQYNPLAAWDTKKFFYSTSVLSYVPYEWFTLYDYASNAASTPSYFTIGLFDSGYRNLIFAPVSGPFSVTAFYYKKAQELDANTDIPSLPEEFHRLIVYRAAGDFAGFIGNGNLYQLYNQKADVLLSKLMRTNNPSKKISLRGRVI